MDFIGCVILHADTFRAWFTGYDDSFVQNIGYATSLDGITWDKYENNPVLAPGLPGSWDQEIQDNVTVVLVDSTYHLWYQGTDGDSRIGYATSPDGIHWTKYAGNPVIDLGPAGSWDEGEVMHPSVIYKDSIFHMWYNGYGQGQQRTGYAKSNDGINWEKHNTPVLTIGEPDEWDGFQLIMRTVLFNKGKFHMWYSACDTITGNSKHFQVGYASALDTIHWTKYENNPVLGLGLLGSWDSLNVVTSAVIYDTSEQIYKMWYGGNDGTNGGSGYAYQNFPIGIQKFRYDKIPDRITLYQNYPNPFNPVTVISWQLTVSSHVELSIYDILGQKIETLISERQTDGRHLVEWDAADMPNGIYYYQLQIGKEFSEAKKMILIK